MVPDSLILGNAALPHFAGILTVAVLATVNERLRYSSSSFLFILWHLFGVVLHELCHLLAGLLFAARPTGFTVFPRQHTSADGSVAWTLGSVSFANLNAVNSLPVSLAPLVLIWAAFELFCRWPVWFNGSVVSMVGLYAVIFGLLYNAMPSKQDLRIALHPIGLALYILIAIVTLSLFGK